MQSEDRQSLREERHGGSSSQGKEKEQDGARWALLRKDGVLQAVVQGRVTSQQPEATRRDKDPKKRM